VILVDTSVWIDHLRKRERHLTDLLNARLVVIHPFVIGEIALGNIQNRGTLSLLEAIPMVVVATVVEVQHFIQALSLDGKGIGYVDAHLLAAAKLTPGTVLWTRDKRLSAVALRGGLAADIPDEPA
jgi:predicted nucleic acid-binding protein